MDPRTPGQATSPHAAPMPTGGAPSGAPPRRLVAALALSMLLASLGTSIANVALPTLTSTFDASFGQVQWVVLAYLLSMTVTAVTVGRVGDAVGRRRVLVVGLAVFTIASAACALAPTLAVLVTSRSLQGVGAAVMMALPLALVRDVVPPERTGAAMGLLGTTSAVGTALGPAGGGLLIGAFGWPAIFVAMVPLGIGALLLTMRGLPGTQAHARREGRFDWPGALVLTAALVAYALSMTSPDAVPGATTGTLLLAATGLLGVLVVVERRSVAPLVPLSMLRSPNLGGGMVMNLLVATVMMSTLVVGPFYLAGGLGLGPAAIGLTMAIGPVVSACSGVFAGRIVDRAGAPGTTALGLVVMTAGATTLALLPAVWGLPGYVLALVVLTPGYQLFLAANNTNVMADVVPERRGTVSGMLSLSRNLGQITGAAAMGALFAAAAGSSGDRAPAAATVAGMQTTAAVAALLLVAATGVARLVRARGGPEVI